MKGEVFFLCGEWLAFVATVQMGISDVLELTSS